MTTPILGITEIANNQTNQYAVANQAIEDLEAAGNDWLEVDLSAGDVTLTATEWTRHFLFRSDGNAAPRQLTVPATKRFAVVQNTGSATLTVTRGSSTVGIPITESRMIFTDGTANGLIALGGGGGGGASTLPLIAACSDEATTLSSGPNKVTFRAPFAFTLVGVRASLTTASSSGALTIDVNKNGVTVMAVDKITIDSGEKTSTTAATPPAITTSAFADDDEIEIDLDGAGTGAAGLKVTLLVQP